MVEPGLAKVITYRVSIGKAAKRSAFRQVSVGKMAKVGS
jgi:hypothetical protein